MNVSQLHIYPIKSLQGIEVKEAKVLEKGFEFDRRWMIVDVRNKLVTQRTHPHLSQVQLQIQETEIVLGHNEMDDVRIPLQLEQGPSAEVVVWEDEIEAITAPDHINQWISKIAQEDCRLVFMSEDASRPVKRIKARNNEHVSFADGYPYLIISEASLKDLNDRMEVSLPMHRFRPNIVVTGVDAYAEDTWQDFQIGNISFYAAGRCKRCVFTTIDQATGQKGVEPLKTLATYRREGKEVVFGLNAIASEIGTINVGDQLEVIGKI